MSFTLGKMISLTLRNMSNTIIIKSLPSNVIYFGKIFIYDKIITNIEVIIYALLLENIILVTNYHIIFSKLKIRLSKDILILS